ncbi:hypothetical protein Bca4012_094197 [Brassica carinata]
MNFRRVISEDLFRRYVCYDSYIAEKEGILSSLDFSKVCKEQKELCIYSLALTFHKRPLQLQKLQSPDALYCQGLLNAIGIVVVPGSGFRQVPGTWHFRCTILPQEDKIPAIVNRLTEFHESFMDEFRN